jgi:N-carbamoyl-L-amino-acid hydrolase
VQDACRVEVGLQEVVSFAPSHFAEELVGHVRDAAQSLGHSHMDIVSGAAHDAVYMSRIAPTAMVFVPCEGGISHNELESARPEHLAAGCDVLLHAVLRRAGASGA